MAETQVAKAYYWADFSMWIGGLALVCMALAIIRVDKIDRDLVMGIAIFMIAVVMAAVTVYYNAKGDVE